MPPWKFYHRVMYIAPSSGHISLDFNMPFKMILRRFEVVFWCLEWECCTFERLGEIHLNPPILYYGFNSYWSVPLLKFSFLLQRKLCSEVSLVSYDNQFTCIFKVIVSCPNLLVISFVFQLLLFLLVSQGGSPMLGCKRNPFFCFFAIPFPKALYGPENFFFFFSLWADCKANSISS